MAAADSTALEAGTVTYVDAQYGLLSATADSVVCSFTPAEMEAGSPYGQVAVNSAVSFLRSGGNNLDRMNRPKAGLVTITNLVSNLTLAGNVAKAALAASAKTVAAAHVVTTAEASAQTLTILPGLIIASAIVQVLRSGKVVASDTAVSWSGGGLTVANGSTYTLTAGDVINWLASGI